LSLWFDILLLFLREVFFMSNPTRKMIEVYEMMKDGKPMNFDALVKRLGCKPVTAMVLVCALRRDCNAEIETIRDGRKVESYQLTNAADIATKMVSTKATKAAKTKAVKTPKVKSTKTVVSRKAVKDDEFDVPTLDADLDITEVSDAELADLRNQLGLA
jgi:hypothetical protein